MNKEVIEFGENHKIQGMTSLEISEVTGKRHDAVLRDIRNILSKGANAHNFVEVEYTDRKGEKRPMYQLTPKGCLILASGYDVVLREKIINKLEEYQQKERANMLQLPDFTNPAEAARAWAEEYEEKTVLAIENKRLEDENLQLVAENQELKNDRSYLDLIMRSKELLTITQIAQDYGMSAKAMNKTLANMKIQYPLNGQWILYHQYKDMGYVSSKTVEFIRKSGMRDYKLHTEWTQEGRKFLYEKLKSIGILPMLER